MEGMQKAGLRLTKSQAILRLSLGNWKIRGNSPQERVSRWKDHFSSLLGQPPVVENADEERETIHGPLSGGVQDS